MKWGRMRYSPPSSWFSKFKHKSSTPEINSATKQHIRKPDFPTQNPTLSAVWREGRFSGDAYWTLSFRKERARGRNAGGIKSSGLREMKQSPFTRKKLTLGAELASPRRNGGMNRRARKLSNREEREGELEKGPDAGEDKTSKPAKEDTFPVETQKTDQTSSVEEHYHAFAAVEGEKRNATSERSSVSEWQNSENGRSNEVKTTTEFQKKNGHSRGKAKGNRTKAYCPKTDCRIKVYGDKRKARIALRKREERDEVVDSRTNFDSFAVVKNSFDPQQDFRDSMAEMIIDKGIRRPEELEELLACYLTLNNDGYRNIIIKAFQQVWLELSRGIYWSRQTEYIEGSKNT